MEKRELPEGWEWKKLQEVTLKYINGGTPSTAIPEYWDGPIPWTTSKSIISCTIHNGEKLISEEAIKKSSSNIVPKNNVLIATRVGIGKSAVNSIDIAISQDLTGVILDKKIISPEFFVHYLHNQKLLKKLESSARGSTIKGLQRSDLDRIEIPLPPLPVQRRIVEILEQADALRRLRTQADAETQKLLQSVFYEMFGDPVRNEKGWEVIELGDIALFQMGQSPPGISYNKKGIGLPLLNGPEEFGNKYPNPIQYTTQPKKVCKKGDILFCVRGATAGRMNFADKIYCIGRGLASIREIPNKSVKQYLYQFLALNYNKFQKIGRGSTFINISRADLSTIKIPLPPISLQEKFCLVVEETELIRDFQGRSSQEAENLFEGLMAKVFNGELK